MDIQIFWHGAPMNDTRLDVGWYFYDHTNAFGNGPYASEESVTAAVVDYCKTKERA